MGIRLFPNEQQPLRSLLCALFLYLASELIVFNGTTQMLKIKCMLTFPVELRCKSKKLFAESGLIDF